MHGLDTINERAHRFLACREHPDHAAVESGNDGLDFPLQGIERHRHDMFATLIKIRVRKFEESGVNIQVFDAFLREMTMRIELAGNQNVRSHDCTHTFK